MLPKHDIVINTAYDGKSDIVVSGDLHLQRVRRFKGIRVAGPKSILTIIRRRFGEMIVDEL